MLFARHWQGCRDSCAASTAVTVAVAQALLPNPLPRSASGHLVLLLLSDISCARCRFVVGGRRAHPAWLAARGGSGPPRRSALPHADWIGWSGCCQGDRETGLLPGAMAALARPKPPAAAGVVPRLASQWRRQRPRAAIRAGGKSEERAARASLLSWPAPVGAVPAPDVVSPRSPAAYRRGALTNVGHHLCLRRAWRPAPGRRRGSTQASSATTPSCPLHCTAACAAAAAQAAAGRACQRREPAAADAPAAARPPQRQHTRTLCRLPIEMAKRARISSCYNGGIDARQPATTAGVSVDRYFPLHQGKQCNAGAAKAKTRPSKHRRLRRWINAPPKPCPTLVVYTT